MPGDREETSSHSDSALPSLFIRFLHSASGIRNEVIGTITLIAFLVAIFQAEVLTATAFEYTSSRALLNSFPRDAKIFIAATIGPFIHQGPRHLTDNLGVLLVAGIYLEYQYNRRFIYIFYLIVGYLAAWVPLLMGSVGSVGANGVTFGLTSWLLVHSISCLLEMGYEGALDLRVLHFIAVFFGLVKAREVVALLGMMDGADDVTHFFGAFIGLLLGLRFVLNYYGFSIGTRIQRPE
ncbi:rhomboid family intramembrane serine protease [Halosimplex pelagicum]|uniref:Rhomboid family intramembrane serine protease n=1 Tax=Halosimplex pelagicum TaxID=869886 RepID=A0A7D5PDQ3_9EURY|nr:rhomboid family intramembrane serine protease [Halosimplex pelagicum]QLH83798.1 rhomboid family intramembrane serine protease [Halosimplex pelagicum]